MNLRYAQIDIVTGRCTSASNLSGEVEAANMILLADTDNVNPNDTWDGATWTPAPIPEPIAPVPDPIISLQEQNADLNLQIINLWETLITAGVI